MTEDAEQLTPWGLLLTSDDGGILEANPRFWSWAGLPAGIPAGHLRWVSLLAPASRILYETHFVPRLHAHGTVSEVSLDLKRADGSRFPILVSAFRRPSAEGTPATVSITVFDATETRRFETLLRTARREAEENAEALAQSHALLSKEHERLQVVLRSIADAVVTVDLSGCITLLNASAAEITGVAPAQALGAPFTVLGHLLDAQRRRVIPADALLATSARQASSSLVLVRPDCTERHLEGSAAPMRGPEGRIEGVVLVWRDVTQRLAEAEQRRFEMSHDALTGLLNRQEFERALATTLAAESRGRGASDLLLHIDLDQFKVINDAAGPTAGDQLLAQVAALLRKGIRQTDTLARLAGDEFGVLLAACPTSEGVLVAERLRRRIENFRFDWNGRSYALTASIGLAVLDTPDGTADAALAVADMACRAAKDGGRNRVHRVEAGDDGLRQQREQMGWLARIRRDLAEDRFELHFQPIVRVDGAPETHRHGELLLRLREPDGRLVPPAAFIGAAEQYHQMGPLDRWVVRRAFTWLETRPDVRASVNVSGQSFGDAAFLAYVLAEMATRRFDPAQVCFEITETAAIADMPAALRFIHALRDRGCLFSLDDFGAGLSSFGYLRALPVDFVKIDGSFVKTLAVDPVNRAIVESIHRVARLCQLRTVAEWVEDDSIRAALAAMGVDYAQGWGIGKPMPLQAVPT